jgi:hypothetical protein
VGQAFVTDVDGPAPEKELVIDMLKRGVWAAPALVIVFGLIWGMDGALSTLYGIALICVNFALAASINAWAARLGPAALGAAAMFGFLLRLGLIFIAVLLVRDASWVSLVPLALTIVITHLGLLFWEMRFVSASLAFPGLKPKPSTPFPADRPAQEESTAP